MNTTRTKRWTGKMDSLTTDYLKDVMGKMEVYGDRVQFGLTSPGPRPYYQLTNSSEKKMAFDGNNHLLHPKEDEFVGVNSTPIFSLEQIKAAIAAGGFRSTSGTRSSSGTRSASSGGSPRGGSVAMKAKDLIDAARYEYFRSNRQIMPDGIGEHSAEITELMLKGSSAADAFGEVIKRHF
ncbi:hypothetical protein LT85_0081 [Collimonas arenae]|uniref:Uncharacterized protein n=1 Tax=Collimonas arenae TaxID=279058 RepID=A0A0A1F410_9BURK|nr:hypothetical protein [Collimonas arenae]AIY39241.1 hypothetical protein LT85_0081 [Collimonas arenae]